MGAFVVGLVGREIGLEKLCHCADCRSFDSIRVLKGNAEYEVIILVG